MRALIGTRGSRDVPGGHWLQIDKTVEHLRALGVEIQTCFGDELDLEDVDIVQSFGLTLVQLRECRNQRVPVVLSPIYWDRAYVSGQGRSLWSLRSLTGRVRVGGALFLSALRGRHVDKCDAFVRRFTEARVVYEMADMLLPNSRAEGAAIVQDLSVTTPQHVVPNAVDHVLFNCEGAARLEDRTGVLYIGRFEPHKNQLGLIEAMRGSSIPVTIAGPRHPDHAAYYRRCQERARGTNVTIVPGVPHEELPALYRAARVHVLPSWFETTGLVSLEAALCGCNVVTTDRGYTREYFQDLAWYCDPGKPATIRAAIEAAYVSPFRHELRDRILQNYTWEHTARETLAAYERVLAGRMNGANAAREQERLSQLAEGAFRA